MKSHNKPYFPMFVDLSEKKIVVVGGGKIAARRVQTLLPFAGRILVVAPELTRELVLLSKERKIQTELKNYEREDLYDADLVIAATDSDEVNQDIYSVCKCMGITVNVASDRRKCDFYFPGIVQQENVVIGVTASGADHKKAREVREEIAAFFEEKEQI